MIASLLPGQPARPSHNINAVSFPLVYKTIPYLDAEFLLLVPHVACDTLNLHVPVPVPIPVPVPVPVPVPAPNRSISSFSFPSFSSTGSVSVSIRLSITPWILHPPTVSTQESAFSGRCTSHVAPFLKFSFGPTSQGFTKRVPNQFDKPKCHYTPAVPPFFCSPDGCCVHVVEKMVAKRYALETQITKRVSVSSSVEKSSLYKSFSPISSSFKSATDPV